MALWRQMAVLLLCGAHCVLCSVVYVTPNSPSNINCPHESHCYTLHEWMETGAANHTTVQLLSGHHVINTSASYGASIENVDSFTLTGDSHREGTTLTCTGGFTLDIKHCSNIVVSQIVLKFCTIVYAFIEQQISITNVTIIDGGLEIHHYLPDIHEDNSVYRITKLSCDIQAEVYISDNTFINSTIAVTVKSIYADASCIQVRVKDMLIKDAGRSDVEYALHVTNTYSLSLNNVTVFNNNPPLGGLCIETTNKATFTDMKFWNGSPRILVLYKTTEVIIRGLLSFKGNRGSGYGVTITSVEHVTMDESFTSSEIEFTDNHVEGYLFRIYNSQLVWLTYTTMTFIDNTSKERGIMGMDTVYFKSSYSTVLFQNNSALQSKIEGAVLLLEKTRVDLDFDSRMLFTRNSALLSGGITLLDSTISFEDSGMSFEYNKGGNGGGMAFYDRSHIMNSGAERNKTILNFYKNHAMRGGAIFVKDTDYIDSVTHLPDMYFISRPIIQIPLTEPDHSSHAINIDLSNNTATISGNDMYGGWIDSDFVAYLGIITSKLYDSGDHHNAIASDPTRICMCINSVPQCKITEHRVEVYPGQVFEIEAVAIGQRMGIVPAIVIIEPRDNEARLEKGQNIQSVNRNCSVVNIKVLSEKELVTLAVTPQNDGAPNKNYVEDWLPSQDTIIFSQLDINVA